MDIIISDYQPYTEDEVKDFVSNSAPEESGDLKLVRGEEHAGWVDFYFNYNDEDFTITLSIALSDLTPVVVFFENIIDLKDEVAIFLDDECISEALFYAKSIDEKQIRFLIADGKDAHNRWKYDENNQDEPQLFEYKIRCDVIVSKQKLLKEFSRAVKNIVNSFVPYEENLFDINYKNWKDNLRHIISYCERN